MVLAKSYINVAHDDTHLTKYNHMGSNYVLFIFKPLLYIVNSHISAPSRWFRLMVFNATFNNISVKSWQSVDWWRKPEKPPTCCKSLTNFIT